MPKFEIKFTKKEIEMKSGVKFHESDKKLMVELDSMEEVFENFNKEDIIGIREITEENIENERKEIYND